MALRTDIANLQEEHGKKVREAEIANAVVDYIESLGIPNKHMPRFVYAGRSLYGVIGAIHFNVEKYDSTLKMEDMPDILDKFEHVSMMRMKKEGFAPSFVPEEWLDVQPEEWKDKERIIEEDTVCSAKVRVSQFGTQYESFVRIPDIGIFEVIVECSTYSVFGHYTSRKSGKHQRGDYYVEKSFSWSKSARFIMADDDSGALADVHSGQTWATEDSPGNFYAWWTPYTPDRLTPGGILRSIIKNK